MTPEEHEAIRSMRHNLNRINRAFAAFTDSARLARDSLIRATGREWEHPDWILTDDEREALHARALGRTLAAIDDLPERDTGPGTP